MLAMIIGMTVVAASVVYWGRTDSQRLPDAVAAPAASAAAAGPDAGTVTQAPPAIDVAVIQSAPAWPESPESVSEGIGVEPGMLAAPVSEGTAGGLAVSNGEAVSGPPAAPAVAGSVDRRRDSDTGRGTASVIARDQAKDSDVALLTELIAHVDNAGPHGWEKTRKLAPGADLQVLETQACPPANTEAGVRCREKICERNQGRFSWCPVPSDTN